MKISEWKRIKVIEDWLNYDKPLYVGEIFLTGNRVIEQKEGKDIGDRISYYRITKSKGPNIQYMFETEILEEG